MSGHSAATCYLFQFDAQERGSVSSQLGRRMRGRPKAQAEIATASADHAAAR